jgi:hypothetical protein
MDKSGGGMSENTVRALVSPDQPFREVIDSILAVLFLGRALSAQTGGQYNLSWSAIQLAMET